MIAFMQCQDEDHRRNAGGQNLLWSVSLLALLGFAGAGMARAQEGTGAATAVTGADAGTVADTAEDIGEDEEEITDIIVTGLAMPGSVIGDIPPENQLSPADIASYGVSSVSELLEEIADQTQSGMGRDSASGPVILVNGKRISGVNEVKDLPTESILRLDILPEEVALKYGYGTQQKVVNVILRRRFSSFVVDLEGGMATEGQGEVGEGKFIYTRIRNNERLNIAAIVEGQASLLESERGIIPDGNGITDPTGTFPNETGYRTLQAKTREYMLNATYSRPLSSSITASANAGATHSTSKSLNGFASSSLTVPADNPYAQSAASEVIDRYLSDRVLGQKSEETQVQGGVSINANLSQAWQLSFIGNVSHGDSRTGTDRGYDVSALQSAIIAGDPLVNPYGALSPSLLGDVLRDRAVAKSDNGNASLLANGKLLKLPAGDLRTSLRIGGAFSALDSEVTRNGITTRSDSMNRSEGNAQVSFDIPIASRKEGFLGALGTLTLNFNASATAQTGYGTLGTYGYGLNWSPESWISFIVSANEDRTAPGLSQLNSPTVATENVRYYDNVRGETVNITRISGGNADLKADSRHVFRLGAMVKPVDRLNIMVNYINSRTDDAFGTLPAITSALESAFPDRFIRDDSGRLVQVDARPLNFARQEQEQIRSSLNFSKTLREPTRPPRPAGGPGESPNRFTSDGPAGGEGGRPEGDMPPPGDFAGQPGMNRDQGMGNQGMGGSQGGFSGDAGGFSGGAAGPGGGFGAGGGAGGFGGGRRPNFSGGGNGVNLQLSLTHSWYLKNQLVLAEGGPIVDLLRGEAAGSGGGGQPRHMVQFSTGVTDNGLGFRLNGTWRSSSKMIAGMTSTTGDLDFSSLYTMNLRLFANLSNRFPAQNWAKGTRVTLKIDNIFNQRQRVTDSAGNTPFAYQPGYLDPVGRSIEISVRRSF